MKEIKRITIASTSGYVPVNYVYEDKLSLTDHSIKYEYTPYLETENNQTQKWSYQTNSLAFRSLFAEITEEVLEILDQSEEIFVEDLGSTTFTVYFMDKTKTSREFWLSPISFSKCLSIINRMIPPCESTPELLKYSESED